MSEPTPPHVSETSKCRARLLPYCQGEGLDIGFGGDPIKPEAITIDLPEAYTCVGGAPKNLSVYGNFPHAHWFSDKSLNFVYSSHLIEDFVYGMQVLILNEWARVLKVGGRIVLYQPHQQRFEKHCAATGQGVNLAHKEPDYSMERFFERVLRFVNFNFKIIHQNPEVDIYSWEMVLEKR